MSYIFGSIDKHTKLNLGKDEAASSAPASETERAASSAPHRHVCMSKHSKVLNKKESSQPNRSTKQR